MFRLQTLPLELGDERSGPMLFRSHQPNADCMDDLPTDFEGSLGGPPTNQITGASDTTVNESSVTLDPAVRTVGALQVVPDAEPAPQDGEVAFTTNGKCSAGRAGAHRVVGTRGLDADAGLQEVK